MRRLLRVAAANTTNAHILRKLLFRKPIRFCPEGQTVTTQFAQFQKRDLDIPEFVEVWSQIHDGERPIVTKFRTLEELYKFAGLSIDGSLLEEAE